MKELKVLKRFKRKIGVTLLAHQENQGQSFNFSYNMLRFRSSETPCANIRND